MLAAFSVSLQLGCGSSPAPDNRDPARVTLTIDTNQRYQTLEGFGAAIAWYDNLLTEHPNKEELYDVLFAELGLDILRLRNRFRYQAAFEVESSEIVEAGSRSLGRELTILMSSWSPPGDLKVSGQEDCSNQDDLERSACTLERGSDGEFVYAEFADYWNDSLDAYAAIGIQPSFISMQNEPDYHPPDWEGCYFAASETEDAPGYDVALDHVYQRISAREAPPKILGPETIGLQNDRVQHYAEEIDLSQLYGVAHHLYDGDSWQTPDSFARPMRALKSTFPEHPIFQTEFSAETDDGGPFETAWLIHNALTEASAVAYIYWDLIWDNGGLVAVEAPSPQGQWKTERGYWIRPPYYSLQHFAKFTDPGFVRVAAESSAHTLKVSAFESPDRTSIVLVLLNVGALSRNIYHEFDHSGYEAQLVLSTEDMPWQELGSIDLDEPFSLPGRSVATIQLTSP